MVCSISTNLSLQEWIHLPHWSFVSCSSAFLVQAGWWMRWRTTAMPSTFQASASFCQQCLSPWSTISFRGEKSCRMKVIRCSTRRTSKQEKSSENSVRGRPTFPSRQWSARGPCVNLWSLGGTLLWFCTCNTRAKAKGAFGTITIHWSWYALV